MAGGVNGLELASLHFGPVVLWEEARKPYSRDGSRHGRDSEGSMRGVSERKGQSAGEHQQVLKKLREAS